MTKRKMPAPLKNDLAGYTILELLAQGRVYAGYYALWNNGYEKSVPKVSVSPEGKEFKEWVHSLNSVDQYNIEHSWLASTFGWEVDDG